MAAWREPPRPVPAYVRRQRRRQWIIGLLFAILFVVVLELAHAAASRAAAEVPPIAAAAAELTGAPVQVDCETPAESAADPYGQNLPGRPPIWGYHYPGTRHVVASALLCAELERVAGDPYGLLEMLRPAQGAFERYVLARIPAPPALTEGWPPEAPPARLEGWALFDLTHELGHVTNGPNEAAADCYALANLTRLAALFGVPPARSTVLLAYGRQLHDAAPPAYHEGCP